MKLQTLLLLATQTILAGGVNAQQAAHFDMSLTDTGKITETVSNVQYDVQSKLSPFTVAGIDGEALRFDGYSNFVKAGLPVSTLSTEALTVSVVLAAETYPMMQVDVAEDTPTYGTICGNLEDKAGFALQLSSQGDLRFQFGSAYSGGFLFTINGTKKLPRGQWCVVAAVLDKAGNTAKLYLDGEEIGSSRMSRADIVHSTADFYIGKGQENITDPWTGKMLLNTFCGLIDDIKITNETTDYTLADLIDYSHFSPDFSYPLSRYQSSPQGGNEGGLWRPQFHGMPSGAWTNETHGLTYSGGRYHLFFQKNANGPYMSRLHWGHISSENLYDWREEPIAIAPGESYDLKGCWSGCIYEQDGTHYILYTAVDNQKATIAQAHATDETLNHWVKDGIVINGRPAGLSDDFRDPYYFEANGQKYIIVGTGKNGVGACTLHKYENGSWTNDGTIFFQGTVANLHGTFWEMPNVTKMDDDRWLFTCTPLNTGAGVRTLCWVGTIGADGKFTPLGGQGGALQYLEMGGISREGYGLLSPTIGHIKASPLGEGLLLLGIVPDKLPTQTNYEMGWAHNYSLPREISIAADGTLIQKPYSGLSAMRTETSCVYSSQDGTDGGGLLGTASLAPVSGRQIEMVGEFTVSSGACGFHFLKSGSKQASLSYDIDRNTLTLALMQLDRTVNDAGSYNGVYSAMLPRKLNAGEKLKLHVYVDGSIIDVFVNYTWAFSVRVFPTGAEQTEAEVFTTNAMPVSVRAWTLDASRSAADGIKPLSGTSTGHSDSAIYSLQGCRLQCPPKQGVYIKDGNKYVK